MRSAPAKGDPALPPATGLPEAVLAPAGQVPRHEISATTRPWELRPSDPPSATALRLSTCREPARQAAYIPAPRCSPECTPSCRPRAPNQCISRRDAACRVSPRPRRRGKPRLYRLQSIASRARLALRPDLSALLDPPRQAQRKLRRRNLRSGAARVETPDARQKVTS